MKGHRHNMTKKIWNSLKRQRPDVGRFLPDWENRNWLNWPHPVREMTRSQVIAQILAWTLSGEVGLPFGNHPHPEEEWWHQNVNNR